MFRTRPLCGRQTVQIKVAAVVAAGHKAPHAVLAPACLRFCGGVPGPFSAAFRVPLRRRCALVLLLRDDVLELLHTRALLGPQVGLQTGEVSDSGRRSNAWARRLPGTSSFSSTPGVASG